MGAEKSVIEIIGEKEKTKKGHMQYVAVFVVVVFYTIQIITIKFCTKFQNP